MTQNLDIVKRGYELFAAGDLDGVAALFADDAVMSGAGGLGIADTMGVRQGPEGMLTAMQEGLDAFDDFQVEIEDLADAGECVIAVVRISGRGKASGIPQEQRLAHLWVLRNGKVIRGEVHRTRGEALEAARAYK
jgi:ketosteroid isomerase-like protein